MEKDKGKYSREDQAARTRSAEVGKGKSTLAGLNAKNPMSSAKGPYQMLDSTWKDMERTAGHKLDRNSQEDNELAFQLYTKRSEKALEQNGLEVNPGNTYALHVYGPKGGIEFLKKIKANPTGLAIDGMSKEVINGNKPFFYDKNGKPRTNSDSYNTLSTRVGGPNDPGAITLQKNLEKEQILNNQQDQIANQQQQIAEEQAQQQQVSQGQEEVQEEQATDPNQVQNQQMAPVEETSQLSRASNKAGILYTGDRTADANFILPEEPIQEDIKTSGESVQKVKTFAYGGVSSVVNKKSDPPFPKIKSVAETLTESPTIKKSVAPKRTIAKSFVDIDEQYRQFKNAKLDTIAANNQIQPAGKYVKMNLGRSKGAEVDLSIVDAIDSAEKRNKLKRGDIASIVKRETDLGSQSGLNYGKEMKRQGSTIDLLTLSNNYKGSDKYMGLDPLRFFADKKAPGVTTTKDFHGQYYQITDQKALDDYIAKNPNIVKQYNKALQKTPSIKRKNSLDFLADDIKKEKNIDEYRKKYNPGDPKYVGMLKEDADDLSKEKEYNRYLDTKRKIAVNGVSLRGNNLAYGGQVNNDTTLSGKNDGLLNEFNEGGSHEENPNGGVFQGVSSDGVQNTVEEGETKMGNYVFSNRLTIDEKDVENLYLPRETKGMTYADASKFINSFLEENPFDFIIKRTVTGQLESLKIGNDRARKYKEEEEQLVQENEIKKETKDNPELQNAILSQLNVSNIDQENSSSEEESPLENQSGKQQYKLGSYLRQKRYDNGGNEDESTSDQSLAKRQQGIAMAGNVVSAAGTGLSMGMDAFKKFDTNNIDAPDIQKVGVGGAVAKGAVSGAAAGAMFGPWGAAIGGVIGGGLGAIGATKQNKAANKQSINKSDYAFNVASREVPEILTAKYGGMQRKYANGGDPGKGLSWLNRLYDNPEEKAIAKQIMATQLKTSDQKDSEKKIPEFKMKGNSPLQYAEGIGSLYNYLSSRKERPRQIRSEELTKLSSPKYYDESYLQTQLGKEANNLSQAVLATSGGSAASARAMSLAGMSNLNKLKSDSYFKMDEVNRGVYDRDQAESQRIADANVGLRNQDYQANLQEEDYTRARKEMARDNLIKSVGGIGREQSDKNLIYNITGGYNTDGSYDPEGKNTLWGKGLDLYSRIKGQKSKGGLIDAYEKASTMDEKELALDYLNKKYNGKI